MDKKDGKIRCFRRKNERFQKPNLHQYGPQQSIMVWAAMSAEGKSRIIRLNGNVTDIRYQNEALGPALLPFLNRHMQQAQFMQDNAPAHRAFVTRDWLRANNVQVFDPWLAKSPNINPIENLWA